MDPATAALVATGINALLQVWANHKNKPPGWKPSPEDWSEIETEATMKTAAYYKATPEEQARMEGSDQ